MIKSFFLFISFLFSVSASLRFNDYLAKETLTPAIKSRNLRQKTLNAYGYAYFQFYTNDDCTGDLSYATGISSGLCILNGLNSYILNFSKEDCSDLTIQYYNSVNCEAGTEGPISSINRVGNCAVANPGTFHASNFIFCSLGTDFPIQYPSLVTNYYYDDETCSNTVYEFTAEATSFCLSTSIYNNYDSSVYTCSGQGYTVNFYEADPTCTNITSTTNVDHVCQYVDSEVSISRFLEGTSTGAPVAVPTDAPVAVPTDAPVVVPTLQPTNLPPFSCAPFSVGQTHNATTNTVPCYFEVTESSVISIQGLDSCMGQTFIRLYDHQGNEINYSYSTISTCASIEAVIDYASTVTIVQGCIDQTACSGTYQVLSSPSTFPISEPSCTYSSDNPNQCFTSLCPNQILDVNGCNCSGSVGLDLYVNGTFVTTYSNNCGTCPQLSYQLPSTTVECVPIVLAELCTDSNPCSSVTTISVYPVPEVDPTPDSDDAVIPFKGYAKTWCHNPPTLFPTYAPTSYPNIDLSAVQVFSGISYEDYSASVNANDDVIKNTIIFFLTGSTINSFTSYTVKSFNQTASLFSVKEEAIEVDYSLSYYSSTETYSSASSYLKTSVNNGQFDQTLHDKANSNPASSSSLKTAITQSFTVQNNDEDSSSDNGLSQGVFIAIIAGSVAGGLILIGLLYFFVFKSKKNSALAEQENSI